MWGDGLKSYNGSSAFTYDVIGNPLNYNNGSAYTFTWQNGRQLASATVNGVTSNYTYNSDGLRTRKVVGNKVYDYYWLGSQLAMMTITEGSNVITMKFYYDDNGTPIMLDYNDTLFYYVTNLQGDVVGIVCEAKEVGSYVYDAWGNPISTSSNGTAEANIIQNNPLRYRGYIYDIETGFYYLQSRYYDPAICRFINADGQLNGGFLGNNLFAYCDNNPIMKKDPSGDIAWWAIVAIVVGVIAVIGLDHSLAKYGEAGVAVHDDGGKDGFRDRFLFAKGSGANVSFPTGEFTLLDSEYGVYQGTSLTDFGDISFTTFLTAEASVQADFSGLPSAEASAVASIYTMSYDNTIEIGNRTIDISASIHYGAAGAGVEFDFNEGKFKLIPPTYGIVPQFSFDID